MEISFYFHFDKIWSHGVPLKIKTHIFLLKIAIFALCNTKIDPKNLNYSTYGAEFGPKMFLSKK